LDLREYLPATLELVMVSMLLALVVGIPVGVIAGARPNGVFDNVTRVVSIAGVSIPIFWLALLLQLLFFGYLKWLPLGGRVDNNVALNYPLQQITGFYLIDSVVTGNWVAFRSTVLHLILPGFCTATYPIGLAIRMTRSCMVEVLSEPYITAARASGIPRRAILFKLALKNAIMPTLTVLALSFAYSITGAFLVELVFLWPGVGKYVAEGVLSVDFPVIIAVTLVVTVIYIVVNLVVDLLQAGLDPRVTLG
jgi:peptide/nickel transport system permease protein